MGSKETISVLLAEDDKHVGQLLKMLLEGESFAVTWVRCGQAAVETLESVGFAAYDVLVTDLYMPNLDGAGLVDWVWANCRALPVLVITATQSEAIKQRQSEGKVKTIYCKPLDNNMMDELVDEIKRWARAT